MKLETSLELLERVRAHLGNVSYYRVAKVLEVSETTVLAWKSEKGGIGRDTALRVAELLDEPPEYILACIEHEREPSAGVRRLWKRIAEAFRSKAAAISLIALGGLLPSPAPVSAQDLARLAADTVNPTSYALYVLRARRRRRWADLLEAWLTWLPTPARAWRLA